MKKSSCILLFGFLFATAASGQVPYFQEYFLLRKNEAVNVNAIFQDRTGFIWFGTQKGLFRFDGFGKSQFHVSDSLPSENVTAIAEDPAGRIWTGTKDGKLACLENGKLRRVEPDEGNASGEISDMIFDRDGNLWFSTLGDGLYYFSNQRLFRLDENEKMPDLFIYDLSLDEKGNIWAGTDGGIAICSLHGQKVSIRILNYENGLPDNIIKKISHDHNGTAWIATEGSGIFAYHPATGKYEAAMSQPWTYGAVADFLVSGDQLWVSLPGKGLMIIDRKKSRLKIIDDQVNAALVSINTLLEDAEGNIWAGSNSGIVRTPGDYISFVEYREIAKANVMALAVDKGGSIWFSCSEGLFKQNGESGKSQCTKQLTGSPYKNFTVVSLYVDHDGYVWAGLYGDGVLRIHPETGKIQYLNKQLRNGNVLNISGNENTVWLATLGGGTRITISGENLTVKNFDAGDGLSTGYIYQVFTDSRNRVWFATDGKGVDMLDDAGFHHYNYGFKSKVIYGFAEDAAGNVWANVQGDGLYQYDGKRFSESNASNLFRNTNISSLISDQEGNLVVMHDLGLSVFDVRKREMHNLGDEVGIENKKPNLNAVSRAFDCFYFGTDHGMVVLSSKRSHQRNVPEPGIGNLKVAGQDVPVSDNLRFKYNENDITINYLGFWYQNAENVNFRYKLDSYDKDWIASRNHSVTYSSLPPGEYRFQLQVSDLPDFRNAKTTMLSFVVRPPFWQTPGFYLISILACVISVVIYVKFRERRLERDKKILEEKNAELKKTNMELDRFVYSVSHDLRAPLSSMLGVVEISEEETQDALQLSHLGMLKGSIVKLDGFIGDILDYSRNSRLEVRKEEIDFKEMLNEITANLKHAHRPHREPDFKIHINDATPFRSDKNRLDVVLNNLISNAIRYQKPEAENPVVAIEVTTSPSEASIVVKDNGIGISPENQQKIFEMFYRVSENSTGSGLGLYIVKETIEKLQGQIAVDSSPGQGTSFRIRIPNN